MNPDNCMKGIKPEKTEVLQNKIFAYPLSFKLCHRSLLILTTYKFVITVRHFINTYAMCLERSDI